MSGHITQDHRISTDHSPILDNDSPYNNCTRVDFAAVADGGITLFGNRLVAAFYGHVLQYRVSAATTYCHVLPNCGVVTDDHMIPYHHPNWVSQQKSLSYGRSRGNVASRDHLLPIHDEPNSEMTARKGYRSEIMS